MASGFCYFRFGMIHAGSSATPTTTPGSPVLSDGHALYTPGLSENRGGVAAYYSNDRLGNLWTLNGTTKNQLTYADFNGFGVAVSGGLGGTPFGFGGGNGCQSDVDTGLVLMGHRYYDARIGRFISQDPAGSGSNWYAYADNDPVDETDPLGLDATVGEDGFANPNGYNEVPGSAWNDGHGHSGARYLISGSSTDPVSSSGGIIVSGGSVGMFDQPYSSAEVSFYRGLNGGINFFTFDTLDKYARSGSAGDLGLFALAAASNMVGGGEVSGTVDGAKVFAKSLSKATYVERMFKGDAINDVGRLVKEYGGSVKTGRR